MDFPTYWTRLDREARKALAVRMGTDEQVLRNVGGGKSIGPHLAVRIERATDGAVTRREMRPDDWRDLWPELSPLRAKPRKVAQRRTKDAINPARA